MPGGISFFQRRATGRGIGNIPSRELTYPTWGIGKSSSKVILMLYVSYQEGMQILKKQQICSWFFMFVVGGFDMNVQESLKELD